jgi:hypothetical protein
VENSEKEKKVTVKEGSKRSPSVQYIDVTKGYSPLRYLDEAANKFTHGVYLNSLNIVRRSAFKTGLPLI